MGIGAARRVTPLPRHVDQLRAKIAAKSVRQQPGLAPGTLSLCFIEHLRDGGPWKTSGSLRLQNNLVINELFNKSIRLLPIVHV